MSIHFFSPDHSLPKAIKALGPNNTASDARTEVKQTQIALATPLQPQPIHAHSKPCPLPKLAQPRIPSLRPRHTQQHASTGIPTKAIPMIVFADANFTSEKIAKKLGLLGFDSKTIAAVSEFLKSGPAELDAVAKKLVADKTVTAQDIIALRNEDRAARFKANPPPQSQTIKTRAKLSELGYNANDIASILKYFINTSPQLRSPAALNHPEFTARRISLIDGIHETNFTDIRGVSRYKEIPLPPDAHVETWLQYGHRYWHLQLQKLPIQIAWPLSLYFAELAQTKESIGGFDLEQDLYAPVREGLLARHVRSRPISKDAQTILEQLAAANRFQTFLTISPLFDAPSYKAMSATEKAVTMAYLEWSVQSSDKTVLDNLALVIEALVKPELHGEELRRLFWPKAPTANVAAMRLIADPIPEHFGTRLISDFFYSRFTADERIEDAEQGNPYFAAKNREVLGERFYQKFYSLHQQVLSEPALRSSVETLCKHAALRSEFFGLQELSQILTHPNFQSMNSEDQERFLELATAIYPHHEVPYTLVQPPHILFWLKQWLEPFSINDPTPRYLATDTQGRTALEIISKIYPKISKRYEKRHSRTASDLVARLVRDICDARYLLPIEASCAATSVMIERALHAPGIYLSWIESIVRRKPLRLASGKRLRPHYSDVPPPSQGSVFYHDGLGPSQDLRATINKHLNGVYELKPVKKSEMNGPWRDKLRRVPDYVIGNVPITYTNTYGTDPDDLHLFIEEVYNTQYESIDAKPATLLKKIQHYFKSTTPQERRDRPIFLGLTGELGTHRVAIHHIDTEGDNPTIILYDSSAFYALNNNEGSTGKNTVRWNNMQYDGIPYEAYNILIPENHRLIQ